MSSAKEWEPVYQFELSDYAQKVEIYEGAKGQTAYMAIEEGKALDLIDAMLTEIEGGRK